MHTARTVLLSWAARLLLLIVDRRGIIQVSWVFEGRPAHISCEEGLSIDKGTEMALKGSLDDVARLFVGVVSSWSEVDSIILLLTFKSVNIFEDVARQFGRGTELLSDHSFF